jgi:hypothetical protein
MTTYQHTISLMRRFVIFCFALSVAPSAFAQMTFNDLPSYCKAASEASAPTLLARSQNIPRAQAEAMMQGMTDPAAIRMVKEVIAFAYSRPAGTPVETLRSDLREQCIAKKIFVQ